jgi:hypothetical protein
MHPFLVQRENRRKVGGGCITDQHAWRLRRRRVALFSVLGRRCARADEQTR